MVTCVACDAGASRDATQNASTVSAAVQSPSPSTSGAVQRFTVASWNVEWFGDESNGPGNEPAQFENARAVIEDIGANVWGLAEIVDEAQWGRLLRALPAYEGVLASDTRVTAGRRWYSPSEQKLALLVRRPARIVDARVILTEGDASFAGRPPLEVKVRLPDASSDVTIIVVHLKARADETSWRRRQESAERLKRYLDREHPDDPVLIVGDWNDGIGRSITIGRESPFAAFVRDSMNYRFLTRALMERGESSTTRDGALIDHHLATDELWRSGNSATTSVFRPSIRQFRTTTSDHYPVVSRFELSPALSMARP